ncbi:MAG: prepilin peptidase [Acidobacteria bacterium Pan2503]|uniref:Prepilin peptidase n=1 Tax=Candidatus Acidiferrum panamense TaxID=2741543 RepID=A0A7V8NS27_9BACT|nr:prepilin peptidase [Candidatus Acidoferrum panamensis]
MVIVFFLFGLVIGSFLNVCITRIPEDVSIILPGSRCPKCGTAIKVYDNVPVFAWIWLGGKCRACGTPISVMYPLVELATGLLFAAAFLEYGVAQATVKWLFFTCLIIVLTITDLRMRLLPDLVTWPGFAVGLMFSWFVPPNEGLSGALGWRFFHQHLQRHLAGLLDGILGAAFGSFLLWGLAAGYKLVRKREGMGMGDVKMMAMVGAFMGWRGTFWTILLGSLLGSAIGLSVVVALYLAGWQRKLAERGSRRGLGTVNALRWTIASQYQLPLGTFLGIGALAVVYLDPAIGSGWPAIGGIFR